MKRGVELVGKAGEALDRIVDSVAEIAGHVGDIAVSAEEQSTGLDEINAAMSQLDQVTQKNAAMFEDTAAASHALSREAQSLTSTMSHFVISPSKAKVISMPDRSEIPPNEKKTANWIAKPIATGFLAAAAFVETNFEDKGGWEDF